jgi:hypothetical protein
VVSWRRGVGGVLSWGRQGREVEFCYDSESEGKLNYFRIFYVHLTKRYHSFYSFYFYFLI